MMRLLQFFRDWSEVWALLIPLILLLVCKPKGNHLRWVIWYVVSAFIFNFLAVFTVEYYDLFISFWKWGNGLFYNLHSFVMVIFFSGYIINLRKYKYTLLLKSLVLIYLAYVLINFSFFESAVLKLSTSHFTAGSIVLLILCLFYFLRSIMEESQNNWLKHPSFIICTAVCLYQAITFFIFLFIYPMFDKTYNQDQSFAFLMMRIYQVIFVVFCVLLAFAFYKSKKQFININS
jgi:hypothetical protein